MRSTNPLFPIKHLIGETGFPSKDDLASFCLSVGLFHDHKVDKEEKPQKKWDPLLYKTGPMLEIIAYQLDPKLQKRIEIKHLLYQYYLGGIEIVSKKVLMKAQIAALRELSGFIPP